MPKITISNQGQKVVDFNLNNETHQTVLTIIQEKDIYWMHACGGKGRCTTCRFNIIKGLENLADPTQAKKDFMGAGKIAETQRMACQVIPLDNIEIEVPNKCKLPGVNYTN